MWVVYRGNQTGAKGVTIKGAKHPAGQIVLIRVDGLAAKYGYTLCIKSVRRPSEEQILSVAGVLHDRTFAVKVAKMDQLFFAVDQQGEEIALEVASYSRLHTL